MSADKQARTIAVVGGGAAGMIAAGFAAKSGTRVLLFEKNEKLGKKIYITGKGRCNMTNACPPDECIENVPGNPYFLYSAFYSFSPIDTIAFFNLLGLQTKIERGNRVFPVSDKASDVNKALARHLQKNNVEINLSSPVKSILTGNGKITGIRLENGKIQKADSVIVATGGLSYPVTGSTGDGYRFARSAGHTVTPLLPSLVSLKVSDNWNLQGLSLKNVEITLWDDRKVLYKDFGEMLFTHDGVSGPIILSASRFLIEKENKRCLLTIDLKPALDEIALDARLLRDFTQFSNKDFSNSLSELLPQKLIPIVVALSGIESSKKTHSITKEERKRLGALLKSLPLVICGTGGFDEAVVTAGGVCVDEINPQTMESKLVKGLFFAGEVIDVDGYTGGFNLQIAFSTGFLSGSNA